MSTEGIEPEPLFVLESPGASNLVGNVSTRLKLLREAYGISQRELAKRAGVTNSSISMIELGQVSPSIHSLERILSVIPITLSDFFAFETTPAIRISRDVQTVDTVIKRDNTKRDQLNFRRLELPSNASSQFGLARRDACGVVMSGSGVLRLISITEPLLSGDIFYIPAQQIHQFVASANEPLKLFICSSCAQPS